MEKNDRADWPKPIHKKKPQTITAKLRSESILN